MNPVPFPSALYNLLFLSTACLTIGIVCIAACWIILDLMDTRKKD
jgi:hypothetical protein